MRMRKRMRSRNVLLGFEWLRGRWLLRTFVNMSLGTAVCMVVGM